MDIGDVVELGDIIHKSGSDNTGGIFEDFFFARKSDIASWPVADPSEPLVLGSGFSMLPDKRFYVGYLTPGTGSIKWSFQGPRDGKNFKTLFKFFTPGLESKTLATLSAMKNDNLVFVARDKNHVLRVLGTEFISAKLEDGEGGTGEGSEDSRGNTLTFVVDGTKYPPLEFKGELPLVSKPSPL